MKKRFFIFNGIIFIILFVAFASSLSNNAIEITYYFAGNNILNQHSAASHKTHTLVLQIFSGLGLLIQLIFVNLYMLKEKNVNKAHHDN
jgi:hypothetical protein